MNALSRIAIASGIFVAVTASPFAAFGQDYSLKVQPQVRSEDGAFDLHRALADRITAMRIPPPNRRIEWFRQLSRPTHPTIIGWEGVLTEVEPVPGGFLVAIRVSAHYDLMSDTLSVVERYAISDRGVRYLGTDEAPPPTSRYFFGH